MYQFNRKEYEERMKWYQDARFGMFIHWGLYSIPARGEWVRSTEEMPEEEYLPFMKEFDARDYNPKQWAKEAKAAGMKYVVLTAKHHDGFCLFDLPVLLQAARPVPESLHGCIPPGTQQWPLQHPDFYFAFDFSPTFFCCFIYSSRTIRKRLT